ncbi:UDP-N-acetylmuramate dehydrogenase [Psittacicella hinzii]|uniref:UDP-N-acetylenolpyruvoylglucosamine reductase n=1 Tax=Psittacicella hinzii TaxID=2028575 RepID=A0A3A1Y937_9GAMM|nr:UDP-N-acetylmuramate dehydrogenase [Psittacicella hinzii]RIY34692.1 UDP-N-acetylenolpyruvoylglucosamine reductase [Psittacicella hinzii]
MIQHSADNKFLTTFRIPVHAQEISTARWPHEFYTAYHRAKENNQDLIILGQGSNVLFVEDYHGEILINKYTGINVSVTPDSYILKVNSGVTIDELIAYCHRFKIYGLENLSLIPSSIGTAAIGNIGAYGVEFERFVDHVVLLNLETGIKEILHHQQLEFAYRHSILKEKYSKSYAVLTVQLRLPKKYQPVLTYSPLNQLDPNTVTAKQVQEIVVQERKRKLPDYNEKGNAGSFFINPIVDKQVLEQLMQTYEKVPSYPVDQQKVKLSAGWLIEHTGLKGFNLDHAQVSPQHALVLTNTGLATGSAIAKLAAHVQQQVFSKFNILLQPEIRFIAKDGEVNATEYLKTLWH